jgi:hypothetical protein
MTLPSQSIASADVKVVSTRSPCQPEDLRICDTINDYKNTEMGTHRDVNELKGVMIWAVECTVDVQPLRGKA